MTLSTPSAGAAPGLSAACTLNDIRSDALRLAGLLHILDNFDPTDLKAQSAIVSLVQTAAELAWKVTDDLERVM